LAVYVPYFRSAPAREKRRGGNTKRKGRKKGDLRRALSAPWREKKRQGKRKKGGKREKK